MRNFARIFAYLLLAILILGACSPQSTPAPAATEEPAAEAPVMTEESAPPVEPVTVVPAPATEAPAEPTNELPDLGGRKVAIAVENAYPPFNMIDPKTNQGVGWDYDSTIEICKRLNCEPEFIQAAWDGIFPAMQAGEFDVLADGVTITAERDEIVDFSIPYVTVGQVLLVRSDETLDADAMIADATKVVSTQLGTTNEIVAKEYFPEERVQSFEDFGAAVLALLSGDVDGVVIDNVTGAGFMKENEGKMKLVGELTSDEQLGFVFPPDSELKAAWDAALESMIADGMLAEINQKWGLAAGPAEEVVLPDLGGRTITVAVENAYPPFNMIDPETNEGVGWDYDLLPVLCERINCVPEFVQISWDGIFPAMQAGEFDVLADGITITAERDEIVDFSIPYVTTVQGLLVRADETADLEAIQADENKLVSTQLGTTNEIVALEYFPVERIKSFEDFGSAVLALLSGDVDAVVIDNVTAAGYMADAEGQMKIIATLASDQELGFVFPPDSELKAAFDAALQSMVADGTLEEINKKWGLVQ